MHRDIFPPRYWYRIVTNLTIPKRFFMLMYHLIQSYYFCQYDKKLNQLIYEKDLIKQENYDYPAYLQLLLSD